MKNIFLLPSKLPSRLIKNQEDKLFFTIQTLPIDKLIGCFPHNIYITNSEEIKEGNYFYDSQFSSLMAQKARWDTKDKHQSKIILTTDPELIKNGVQSLDDNFLNWFVKNPSCEFVEVEEKCTNKYSIKYSICWCVNGSCGGLKYTPIIPTQERKQDRTCLNNCSVVCGECQILQPKQETIEEAGLKHCELLDKFPALVNPLFSFKEGAKHQSEKMFSNEDMVLFSEFCDNNYFRIGNTSNWCESTDFENGIKFTTSDLLNKWLTQHKKH